MNRHLAHIGKNNLGTASCPASISSHIADGNVVDTHRMVVTE